MFIRKTDRERASDSLCAFNLSLRDHSDLFEDKQLSAKTDLKFCLCISFKFSAFFTLILL